MKFFWWQFLSLLQVRGLQKCFWICACSFWGSSNSRKVVKEKILKYRKFHFKSILRFWDIPRKRTAWWNQLSLNYFYNKPRCSTGFWIHLCSSIQTLIYIYIYISNMHPLKDECFPSLIFLFLYNKQTRYGAESNIALKISSFIEIHLK